MSFGQESILAGVAESNNYETVSLRVDLRRVLDFGGEDVTNLKMAKCALLDVMPPCNEG